VQSKKRSSIVRRRRKNCYFLDRNLGRIFLPAQLRKAGLDITAQDDTAEFRQTERDPWMFYMCGKRRMILVTSDLKFHKSFPHMAAIALGNTMVIAFTHNNYNSDVRGRAFIKALPQIEDAIATHRRRHRNFIGIVGMQGTFRVAQEKPLPHRATCDLRDWESYARVCAEEGVLALAPEH
jgi:hypothetical protein